MVSVAINELHGPVPGQYVVEYSRGPRARGIPSHSVVTGPVWGSSQPSPQIWVLQAPVLVV